VEQKQPTLHDIIYAAGLFDGEGCVTSTTASKGNRSLRVSLASTCLDLVEFMELNFGGKVYKRIDRRSIKAQHQWHIGGAKAVEFLKLIFPYMREVTKRARAEVAITQIGPLIGYDPRYGFDITKRKRAGYEALMAIK